MSSTNFEFSGNQVVILKETNKQYLLRYLDYNINNREFFFFFLYCVLVMPFISLMKYNGLLYLVGSEFPNTSFLLAVGEKWNDFYFFHITVWLRASPFFWCQKHSDTANNQGDIVNFPKLPQNWSTRLPFFLWEDRGFLRRNEPKSWYKIYILGNI